jgi:hypothetical protein
VPGRNGFRIYVLALCLWISHFHLVIAQAIDPDIIDFTKISGWKDLRVCLQGCFLAFHPPVQETAGCTTNACLCRPSTLGLAIQAASDCALKGCQNLDDQVTARKIVIDYCAAKGYTSIVSPTVLQSSTGAFTVTVIHSATATQTVVASSAPTISQGSFRHLGLGAIAISVLFIEYVLFLCG